MTWKEEYKVNKHSINCGDRIATSSSPVWDMEHTGVPITDTHKPCGYWYDEPFVLGENPPATGPLYSTGRNVGYVLLREGVANQNEFGLIDPVFEFIDVSLGNANVTIIKADGTLSVIGGIFSATEITDMLSGCIKCSCSDTGSAYVIKTDGSMWGFGANFYGELGAGDNVTKTEFTQVTEDGPWASVSSGYYCCFAIKEDGSLWSCGFGSNGNLGFNNNDSINEFAQVSVGPWAMVSQGTYPFALAITTEGALYGCGYNGYGQLCLDNKTATKVFTARGDGNIWADAKTGFGHSILLKNDGTIWTAGFGVAGQLGHGDDLSNEILTQVGAATWASIGAGERYTVAINSAGNAFAAGQNTYGQLGIGDNNAVNVLTACVGLPASLNARTKISCGTHFAYALKL